MSTPRSYLFVPGNSERKMAKAIDSGADAVILDLEDSVPAAEKTTAGRLVSEFLAGRDPQADGLEYWVRVNTADDERALAELAALPLSPLAGIVYPKLSHRAQLERIGHWLDALETRDRLSTGALGVIGIMSETADALVGHRASTLAEGHPRLRGYTWGMEDLSAALGRTPVPGVSDAARILESHVQIHCRLTAAAAGVDAIDAVDADFRDLDGLAERCARARELGFVGKMAIHPAQIEIVNAALAPSEAELDWARRVQQAQASDPQAASFALDGRMIDQPHFAIAARLLARGGRG